jgi:hypothetical protein
MTIKNSLQDGQKKSVSIFDFKNFLFQIVIKTPGGIIF